MKKRYVCLSTVLALLAFAGGAEAQLPQPRCDGYPPVGRSLHLRSTLIGYAGQPCYGQVFNTMVGPRGRARGRTFGAGAAIDSLRIVKGPAHGSFQMIGTREFKYTPRKDLRGWDKIVLEYTLDVRGERRVGHLIFRATTRDWYATAGQAQ